MFAALFAVALAWGSAGCANPTAAYHRNFDYLSRTGDEALAEGRLEDAREHLAEAAELSRLAAVDDLELIDVLTRLTRATREQGDLAEARSHVGTASHVLARHRLRNGGTDGDVRRVGGALLLERARVEMALGDLLTAEAVLDDFVALRGQDGGDDREAAEALWTLGELKWTRGLETAARASFSVAAERARGLAGREGEDLAALAGFVLFRAIEVELSEGRAGSARQELVAWRREGRLVPKFLEPGMLLVEALVDVAAGERERAGMRLADALDRLAAGEEASLEPAAPARAIQVASRLFAPGEAGAASSSQARVQLVEATRRALDAPGRSPLRAVLAGREAIRVSDALRAAGDPAASVSMLEAGRNAIAAALGDRDHASLVEANVALATALSASGRLAEASEPCGGLIDASTRLLARFQEARIAEVTLTERETSAAPGPQQLMACAAIEERRGRPVRARKAYGLALGLADEAAPGLRMELLLRLSALAHHEAREAEEEKLFERLLVYVMPGAYERLTELLIEAYGPQGPLQPSAAAARLAHLAARLPRYGDEAPQIHAVARALSGEGPPASR